MVIRLILSLSWGELGGIAADRAIGTNIVRSSVLSIFQNIRITESEMLCDPPVPLQVSLPRCDLFCICLYRQLNFYMLLERKVS